MGMPEICQTPLTASSPVPKCNVTANLYRQCARGCAKVVAYCHRHGGDERAVKEMVDHMKTHEEIK